MKDTLTTLILIFLCFKLIDFSHPEPADYLTLFLAILLIALSAWVSFKKGRDGK